MRARCRPDDDRGAILVFLGFSLVALLAVSTLVVDGGLLYTQRRTMQLSADAAAMAGTRALDKARFSGGSASAVATDVASVATANGAESSTCTVVEWDLDEIGPCTSVNVMNASAAGVKVTATDTRQTSFGAAIGVDTASATVGATATMQPLTGTQTPFIICGNAGVGGYDMLNPDGTLNATAAQAAGTVALQGSQVPTCGAGSAFKGKNGGTDPVRVGETTEADNGNGYEQDIRDTVLGAAPCPDGGPFTNCDILVPIADSGIGNGNTITMHIAAWGVFRVTGNGNGNPKYYATFLSTSGLISGGETTAGPISDGGVPRVIKLAE